MIRAIALVLAGCAATHEPAPIGAVVEGRAPECVIRGTLHATDKHLDEPPIVDVHMYWVA